MNTPLRPFESVPTRSRLQWAVLTLLLATGYFVLAQLGFRFASFPRQVSAVWPPSGLALGALLLFGRRLWPGIFLGATLANLSNGLSLPAAAAIGAGNSLEAAAAYFIIHRFTRFSPTLKRLSQVVALTLVGPWLGALLAASVGTASLSFSGIIPAGNVFFTWWLWWFGDVLGMLVLTPFILLLNPRRRPTLDRKSVPSALAMLVVTGGLTVWVFSIHAPLVFLLLAVLALVIFRFGKPGAAAATLLIAMISVTLTSRAQGPFFHGDWNRDLIVLQTFIGVMAVAGQLLAAALAERNARNLQELKLARQQAEAREARRSRERYEFLAKAGSALSSSLDVQATLKVVARQVVPRLADYCVVPVLSPTGEIESIEVAHAVRSQESLLEQLKRFPPDPRKGHPVGLAIRKGKAILRRKVGRSFVVSIANDPEHLRLLELLNPISYIAVPLQGRERILGAIVMVRTRTASGRTFTRADFTLAQELAGICSLAIENSWLYRQAQHEITARMEFLSIAAHELKNPVTGLRAMTYLARKLLDTDMKAEASQRLRDLVRNLEQQSTRLSDLVLRLLDFGQIEAGRLALECAQFDVAQLVRDLVERYSLRENPPAIQLRAPSSLVVWADPLRLEQVLVNLFENAIKHGSSGGRTQLDVTVEGIQGDSFKIVVRDFGPGIAPEMRGRIFQKYFKSAAPGRTPGMGLGLFITHEIVKIHGGKIALTIPPDGGTRFAIELPRRCAFETRAA